MNLGPQMTKIRVDNMKGVLKLNITKFTLKEKYEISMGKGGHLNFLHHAKELLDFLSYSCYCVFLFINGCLCHKVSLNTN